MNHHWLHMLYLALAIFILAMQILILIRTNRNGQLQMEVFKLYGEAFDNLKKRIEKLEKAGGV